MVVEPVLVDLLPVVARFAWLFVLAAVAVVGQAAA